MSARNLVPAAFGTFQTRASRIAKITGTRTVNVARPGGGGMKPTTVYTGMLFKMDGRTVDTRTMWNPDGSHFNTNGVASERDLCIIVRLEPTLPTAPAQAAPEPGIANPSLSALNAELQSEVASLQSTVENQAAEITKLHLEASLLPSSHEVELIDLRAFKAATLAASAFPAPQDGGPAETTEGQPV